MVRVYLFRIDILFERKRGGTGVLGPVAIYWLIRRFCRGLVGFSLFTMLCVTKVVFCSFATRSIPIGVYMGFYYDSEFITRRALCNTRINSSFGRINNGKVTRNIQASIFNSTNLLYRFLSRVRCRSTQSVFTPTYRRCVIFRILLSFPTSVTICGPIPCLFSNAKQCKCGTLFTTLAFCLSRTFIRVRIKSFRVTRFQCP